MSKAPVLRRNVKGIKRYNWRRCPYSTADVTNRIPVGEKTEHTVTDGKMQLSIPKGHDSVGWVCKDPNCSFYLGTATTSIKVPISRTSIDYTTGEYTITADYIEQPICSGTFFWEK